MADDNINTICVVERNLPFFYGYPYTCYEIAHTWEPKCHKALWMIVKDSFKSSLKLYATFYGITGLLKLLKKKNRKFFKRFLYKELIGVARSSLFLTCNVAFFSFFFCFYRYIFKRFYRWHGLLAGFSSGLVSIMVEREQRRGLLATYCSNLALQTLYQMAKSRNWVRGIKNGEVLVFSVASTGFMSLLRSSVSLSLSLRQYIEFVVGNSESPMSTRIHKSTSYLDHLFYRLPELTPTSKSVCCYHQHGCLFYILKGSIQQFVTGYLIELMINFLRVIRSGESLRSIFYGSSLALFLSSYVGLFRSTNCLLRWLRGEDEASLHGAISGLIAGLAFYFYKSTPVALFCFCKLIMNRWQTATQSKHFPEIPYISSIVYAASVGILLSASWLEPHTIRPQYRKFIWKLAANKPSRMFRKAVSGFLPDQNTLYVDYIPKLDVKYIKSFQILQLVNKYGL